MEKLRLEKAQEVFLLNLMGKSFNLKLFLVFSALSKTLTELIILKITSIQYFKYLFIAKITTYSAT